MTIITKRMVKQQVFVRWGLSVWAVGIVLGAEKAATADETASSTPPGEIVYFQWRPEGAPEAAYHLPEAADQHRIILPPGVKKNDKLTVVVGFHGQPKRGRAPRDYNFVKSVPRMIRDIAAAEQLDPFVFVMPVFRFHGQNWPGFDLAGFRKKVENILKNKGIKPTEWLVFGHSGAAGCGGDGLNQAHRMAPKAVGFFDTCLGTGWQRAVAELKRRRIDTVMVHSVETAGFRPRQVPEYQSDFDFGRAYGPVGLAPADCPADPPGDALRDQPYRCASASGAPLWGFVVDTGEGVEAHEAVLPVAIRYFLKRYLTPPKK